MFLEIQPDFRGTFYLDGLILPQMQGFFLAR